MSSHRRFLCALYASIAAVALIGTWRQNLAFMAEAGLGLPEGFLQFWPALLANRATTSITVDIFLFALAATVWMVLEARKLGIRFVWLYVVFGITVAISVTFPLFLIARERRLARVDASGMQSEASTVDKLALSVLTLATFAFAAYCTLR